jgi:predicted MFS family arabinose efflux permease
VSSAGWRWAFYLNLAVGAVCAPVYLFMLPNKDPRPGVSFMDRAREMDYVGSVSLLRSYILPSNWPCELRNIILEYDHVPPRSRL